MEREGNIDRSRHLCSQASICLFVMMDHNLYRSHQGRMQDDVSNLLLCGDGAALRQLHIPLAVQKGEVHVVLRFQAYFLFHLLSTTFIL